MSWVKGKEYWDQLRAKGWKKPKAIETPEKMWALFLEYAADVDENPAEKSEQSRRPFKDEDGAVNAVVKFKVQRPYSWVGFQSYLATKGIITSTLKEYKQNRKGNYTEYSQVVACIDNIMYNQKFEGAAMGHFNSSIIMRDLGLAEKREIAATLEDDIDYSQLSESALEEIAKAKKEARTSDWNAGLERKH